MASREDSFGGRAGDAVLRAVSPAALITGVLFGIVVGVTALACLKAGAEKAAPVLMAIIVSGFLAHAAVDAFEANWKAGRPTPFAHFMPVALRYLLLQALFVIPLMLVGWKPGMAASLLAPEDDGGVPRTAMLAVALYVMWVLAAPPLLLIGAVAARETREVFAASHWLRCFRGRGSDVFLIYVLYLGSMLTVLLLCAPLMGAALLAGPRAFTPAAAFSALFAVGTSILLLGQLCGEFARPLRPEEPHTKIIAHLEPASPPLVAASAPLPAVPRKGPLLDAPKRLERIARDSAGDPHLSIPPLEELREGFTPNPMVLQALSAAYLRAGRREEALAVAREAIPLCVRSGATILAAELVVAFRESMEAAGVTAEQAVSFADALRSAKRVPQAAALYGALLSIRPPMPRAVKGALLTAQDLVAGGDAKSALPLFETLAECAAGTPMEEYVRAGRADAERKAGPA